MKLVWLILAICTVILGCNPDELQPCKDIDNQNWLTQLIDQYSKETDFKVELHSYSYRSQIVVVAAIIDNPCDLRNVMYDCDGRIICQFGCVGMLNACSDFPEAATDKKLLFKN